ncbi:imm11 family protein [Pseudahrensia aquimaris]|uniref:Imm11 family protein n=1 Tax=Pseudahrensia aquimaris TaxID=744461 RepID=A0ABW3FDD5_9HYPH
MAATISRSNEARHLGTELRNYEGDHRAPGKAITKYLEECVAQKEEYRDGKYHSFGSLIGHTLPPELFPKTMIFTKGKKLYNMTDGYGKGIVTQAFKDCHKAVQPEGNQFIPVTILNKDETPHEGNFYFFWVDTVCEALNLVSGGVHAIGWYPEMDMSTATYQIKARSPGEPSRLAVYSDRIEGLAAWQDPRMPRRIFFSDAFLARLREAKCQGWHESNYFHERPDDWLPEDDGTT